jgi:spermidine/putrescine transport system substrate-binding protein
MTRHTDPALLRGLTSRRYDRRDALKALGLGAAFAAAACSVKGAAKPLPDASQIAGFWKDKVRHGHVNFANWADYMDAKRTPLEMFRKETGISYTYSEVITEDAPWYGKIQPLLAANKSIGYDLMVVTNGVQMTKLIEFGYLAPLDHSRLPNFAKYADPIYKNESFDKGNVFTIPYTTGYTGIAYNPKYVKEPITSINALWDPKYKGHVGMMADTQELGNFGMFAVGADPETSTKKDWEKAARRLRKQKDAGIVRQYVEQDYTKSLANGDLWLSMAWSGDVFQENVSNGSNLQFVVPREGGTIWTDNMCMPVTAKNPVDAITLMDFFYRPDIAAKLAEIINYVTPVPASKAYVERDAQTAGSSDKSTYETMISSPLVYPDAAELTKLRHYRALRTPTEEQDYQNIFLPITGG